MPPIQYVAGEEPDWLIAALPAIGALGMIERYGFGLCSLPEDHWAFIDPALFQDAHTLAVELDRLEGEDRAADAGRHREQRAKARS